MKPLAIILVLFTLACGRKDDSDTGEGSGSLAPSEVAPTSEKAKDKPSLKAGDLGLVGTFNSDCVFDSMTTVTNTDTTSTTVTKNYVDASCTILESTTTIVRTYVVRTPSRKNLIDVDLTYVSYDVVIHLEPFLETNYYFMTDWQLNTPKNVLGKPKRLGMRPLPNAGDTLYQAWKLRYGVLFVDLESNEMNPEGLSPMTRSYDVSTVELKP